MCGHYLATCQGREANFCTIPPRLGLIVCGWQMPRYTALAGRGDKTRPAGNEPPEGRHRCLPKESCSEDRLKGP